MKLVCHVGLQVMTWIEVTEPEGSHGDGIHVGGPGEENGGWREEARQKEGYEVQTQTDICEIQAEYFLL